MINSAIQSFFFKFAVDKLRPFFTPFLQGFRSAPIGCRHRNKIPLAIFFFNALTVFIQIVNSMLLCSPGSILVQRTNGNQHMKMGIGYVVLIFSRQMKCKIYNHARRKKLLSNKLPCEFNIFFQSKFILHGNIKTISKLCIPTLFKLLQVIP